MSRLGSRVAAGVAFALVALLASSALAAAASGDDRKEGGSDGEKKERRSGDEKKEERAERRDRDRGDDDERKDRDGRAAGGPAREEGPKAERTESSKPGREAAEGKAERQAKAPKGEEAQAARGETAQPEPESAVVLEPETKRERHGKAPPVEGPAAPAVELVDSSGATTEAADEKPRRAEDSKHEDKRPDLPIVRGSHDADEDGAGESPVVEAPAPPAIDVTDRLEVAATPRGNLLQWTGVKETGGTVQVWRQDNPHAEWTVIATRSATGSLVDDTAPPAAAYKLTWASQSTALDGGTTVVLPSIVEEWQPALAKSPAGELIGPSVGHIFLGLLWLGAGLLGALRQPAPPSGPTVSLRGLLARVPGVDDAALRRLEALGLGSTAQLMALDPDAVDFWAGLEPGTAKSWQSLVALTDWPDRPLEDHATPVGDGVAVPMASPLPFVEPAPAVPALAAEAPGADSDAPALDIPDPIIDLPEEMPMGKELADSMVLRLRRTPTA